MHVYVYMCVGPEYEYCIILHMHTHTYTFTHAHKTLHASIIIVCASRNTGYVNCSSTVIVQIYTAEQKHVMLF